MNILALDLGKNNTVFCDYNCENGKYEFGQIPTTPPHIHDLIVARQPQRLVLEICTLAGWIHDIAVNLEVKEVEVANVNHEAWRWKNVKRKNDREDALKLAKLSAMKQLPTVHMPTRQVRQKRSLIQYRHKLVQRRTQIKNAIRALLNQQGLTLPKGHRGWSGEAIQWLESQGRRWDEIDMDQMWRGQLGMEVQMLKTLCRAIKELERQLNSWARCDEQIQRLQTIAGVGPRLAETIVAFLDEPQRFDSGKQVGSYVGLTPKQYQSGQMNRQGRISGQGNKMLRQLLVEASWVALRYNPWARETYERLLRGSPTRKNIAIVALARKLVVRCWAMLRDEQPWRSKISRMGAA